MSEKKKPPRSDTATVHARVLEVLNIRLAGATFTQVQQYAAEKGWGGEPGAGLSERQLRVYMARSSKIWAEQRTRKSKEIIERHLARREDLYARAVAAGDVRAAHIILADLAKMESAYPATADVKELAKLVQTQNAQIATLMERLDVAGKAPKDGEAQRPAACSADSDAADREGQVGDVPP